MRYVKRWIALVTFFGLLLGARMTAAQSETQEDKTLSPYFFVKSDDPSVDQLPLKSTDVRVNIAGVIAEVIVTQVYKNEGKRPLEAIYVFPASTKAAVYGMQMTIGERTIVAKIARREDARREYEEARAAGKSASLLEQQRPNVFQMNVANILPSDVIKVELRYTELLVPTDGIYEFVYPTVVGPRYTGAREGGDTGLNETWSQNPYLRQGEKPTYTFDISSRIAAGLPIQEVACPSHKVNVDYEGPALSAITLAPSEKNRGNRDFILKYRLAGGRIEKGLLLYKGEKENFFLLMLQPPKAVSDREIPPREYIFMVDVSGSMHGFPLDISKKLLKDLIGNLRQSDRFNVLLFAGGSSALSQNSLPATKENIQHALNVIDRQRGGGGTELLPALQRAIALPRPEGFSRTVVIATDGYVTVEEQVFDLIRNNLGDANMFTFGIGTAVNRHIIEGMAHVGMGEPFVITSPAEAPEKAKKFRELIASPVLSRVKVDFGNFQTYDVEPVAIPDVLADRPVIVFGKWRGKAEGLIRLYGISGEGPYNALVDVSEARPQETNSALRYLWARHRITLLSGYNTLRRNDGRIKEVTGLGLTYNLLTAYTSFVAVDCMVRNTDGQPVTVKQPLPLPEGVSDLAVGNGSARSFKAQAGNFFLAPSTPAMVKSEMARDKASQSDESLKEGLQVPTKGGPLPHRPSMGDAKKPDIELTKITVTVGLLEKDVRQAVEKEFSRFRECYHKAVSLQPGLRGEWTFTLVVGPDGKVTTARMERSAKALKEFEKCMIDQFKSIQFTPPSVKGTVTVTITFVSR